MLKKISSESSCFARANVSSFPLDSAYPYLLGMAIPPNLQDLLEAFIFFILLYG
jgi:hypothetical protein